MWTRDIGAMINLSFKLSSIPGRDDGKAEEQPLWQLNSPSINYSDPNEEKYAFYKYFITKMYNNCMNMSSFVLILNKIVVHVSCTLI